MANNLVNPLFIFTFVSLILSHYSSCLRTNDTRDVDGKNGFSPALGTWYGDRRGAGSTGGACGWGADVQYPPFSSMISAGNPNIFLHGKGCGDCYQIKCTTSPHCSGYPIRVTITDECPGCTNVPYHFDLSGTAFGAMANPGHADDLLNLGQVDIQYQRVECNYGKTTIAFKISEGTTPNWFATSIEFVDGAGDLSYVEIAQAHSTNFVPMQNIWGAVWVANINPSFYAPFSFRLTSPRHKAITAYNVVPYQFATGKTYYSNVNFW